MSLVLTRRPGEAVRIAPDTLVTVTGHTTRVAYLVITAPGRVARVTLEAGGDHHVIRPGVTVRVAKINRDQVRLAFDADPQVMISRTELLEQGRVRP